MALLTDVFANFTDEDENRILFEHNSNEILTRNYGNIPILSAGNLTSTTDSPDPDVSDPLKFVNRFNELTNELNIKKNALATIEESLKELKKTYISANSTQLNLIKLLQDDNDEYKDLQKASSALIKIKTRCYDNIVKKLEEKIATLNSEVDGYEKRVGILREYLILGAKQVLKTELVKNVCSICFTNEINTVLTPCGHTFCDQCQRKNSRKNCPLCSSKIDKTIKMFISI